MVGFYCLSHDLFLEILVRLPGKSLGRFKLVCKSWNSLISSSKFIKFHAQNSNNPPLPFFVDPKQLGFTTSSLDINNKLNTKVLELDNALYYRDGKHRQYFLGSCDGLICMLFLKEKLIKICNPLIKETKEISFPIRNPQQSHYFYAVGDISWFGFVPSINDYIILLVLITKWPLLNLVFVFSMRDDKWRKLDSDCYFGEYDDMIFYGGGTEVVFMNGALHCLSYDEHFKFNLIKFDLVHEVFEDVPININHTWNKTAIGVMQDKSLCIYDIADGIDQHTQATMVVWKLEQYGKWDSWSKLFRLNLELLPIKSCFDLGFTCRGEILVRSKDAYNTKIMLLVDPSRNPPSQMKLGRIGPVRYMLNYVESLVSPFSLVDRQRSACKIM